MVIPFNPSVLTGSTVKYFLIEAALRASGVSAHVDMGHYVALFHELVGRISQNMPFGVDVARAHYLFNWMWQTKPQRYLPGGCFRFNEVLETQLGPGPGPVGNCLGLTVLYNSLAHEFGLKVATVHLEGAFHGVPHIFTLLLTDGEQLDIEHIFPNGFGCQEHLDNPGREIWGDKELVADIYLSQGNVLFEARKWLEAIIYYDMALELNPRYEKAKLNRAMAVSQVAT